MWGSARDYSGWKRSHWTSGDNKRDWKSCWRSGYSQCWCIIMSRKRKYCNLFPFTYSQRTNRRYSGWKIFLWYSSNPNKLVITVRWSGNLWWGVSLWILPGKLIGFNSSATKPAKSCERLTVITNKRITKSKWNMFFPISVIISEKRELRWNIKASW